MIRIKIRNYDGKKITPTPPIYEPKNFIEKFDELPEYYKERVRVRGEVRDWYMKEFSN